MTTAPDPIIGIDLGTTNSLVAHVDGAEPRILADSKGETVLSSVVRLSSDGEVQAIGSPARNEATQHPARTIASVKRLMGRSAEDATDDHAYLSYRIVEGPRGTARVELPGGRLVSPEEVSAHILSRLAEIAGEALGCRVTRCVITVPAYFDDAQRQATRAAARIAGLEPVRIINEPTAAALAYGIGRAEKSRGETIAVYDFGGGTFDVSVLRVIGTEKGGDEYFQVLSTAGDTRLGGDDIDRAIIDLVLGDVRTRFGSDLRFTPSTIGALRQLAEAAKIRLSGAENATIEISVPESDQSLQRTIAREEFEAMILPLVQRTIRCCDRALRDAGTEADAIDRVVMVGGSTRIPLVRDMVEQRFGVEPYTALDPEKVVALGAAIQASVLEGCSGGVLLFDVVPLSLGLETVGGATAKLIMRNSTVPARATEMFSTSVDAQTSIKINVVQGEREMVEDCRSLGTVHVTGIPPMPAGIPQLEVEFLVDANGVLNVAATERRSGKRARMQVVPNHGLTDEEIERIETEAFAHAREDMTRHRVVDLIANSRLDRKWISEALDRVDEGLAPDARAEINEKLDALARLIARAESDWRSVDPNEFHGAKEALDRASIPLHEASIAQSLRREQSDSVS